MPDKVLNTLVKTDSEAVVQRCSVKKMLLQISQNSQTNNCARVSFLGLQLYWKRDSGVFLWILRNFKEHFFYRATPVAASVDYTLQD